MKRFDTKTESKVLKALNNLLKESVKPLTEEQALEEKYLYIMDNPNVILIQALSEQSKRVLSRFISEETLKKTKKEINQIPKLSYVVKEYDESESRYSIDYLKLIVELFVPFKENSVLMKMKKDYPMTFENEHFKVILSPRVRK